MRTQNQSQHQNPHRKNSAYTEKDLRLLYCKWNSIYPKAIRMLELEPSDRILDAGCGTGNLGSYLKSSSYREVVGVDKSELALTYARERTGFKIVKADLTHLPFKDKYFTKVLSIQVIPYCKNPLKALKELKRVCSRYLLITSPNKTYLNMNPFWSLRGRGRASFTLSQLTKMGEALGMRVKRADYSSPNYEFLRHLAGRLLASELMVLFEV